jgi:hypothetical protein
MEGYYVRMLLVLGLLGAALWMFTGYGRVAVSAVHHLSQDVHQIRCDDTAIAEIGSAGETSSTSDQCPGGVTAANTAAAAGAANTAAAAGAANTGAGQAPGRSAPRHP